MKREQLRDLVERAAAAPPAVWALAMLQGEAGFWRLPVEEREQGLRWALEEGAGLAASLPRGVSAGELARSLGASVEWTEEDPRVGPVLFHAEYVSEGARIVLYRKALEPLAVLAEELGLGERLGGSSSADVYLAHELYHHLAWGAKRTRGDPTAVCGRSLPTALPSAFCASRSQCWFWTTFARRAGSYHK